MPEARPAILLYSNCQGDYLAKLMARCPSFSAGYEIRYLFIHGLDEPGQGWDDQPAGLLDGVAIVWEQVSDAFAGHRAELHRRLAPGTRRIRFPALTASMLWPFARPDPRPSRRGLYPYGDRVAARLGARIPADGMRDEDILAEYMKASTKALASLPRHAKIEEIAWAKRDLDCDIRLASYLRENLRTEQLFHEVGRITAAPLRRLAFDLVDATIADAATARAVADELASLLRYHCGYDTFALPVHPGVAECLGLCWHDPDARYRWFLHDLTFAEWVVRCVRLTPYVATLF